jgi:hypothetical protein
VVDNRYNRAFVNDARGNALYVNQSAGSASDKGGRIENRPGGYIGGFIGDAFNPGHIQRQLVANGEVLARYGDAPDSENRPQNGAVPKYVNTAEFHLNAPALKLRDTNFSAMSYTVVGGETLKTVARNVLGDSSLWWRIAEANGLAVSGDGELTAGQTLSIPKLALNANNADTFQPYDPSRVTGSLDSVLPAPAGQGGGCGALGKIIMVAVAVVVAAMVGPAITAALQNAAFAGLGSGALSSAGFATLASAAPVLGTAAGATLGSITSQAAGNLMGVQDGFSWKQVGLAAIAGGVSGGLQGVNLTSATAIDGGAASFGNVIARATMGNVLGQGIGIVTGLQNSFNWRSVTASAVGAGVGIRVSRDLPSGLNPYVAAGITSVAAGTAAAVMNGGKISIQQIAIDAFGNALGNSLAYASQPVAPQDVAPGSAYDYRNGSDIESDRVSEFNAFAKLFTQDYERYEGVDVAGPGGSDIIRKVGASQALKDQTTKLYDGLTDLRAALSMGKQDPQQLLELQMSGLQKIEDVRYSLQSDAGLAAEVMQRGLTASSDLQTLGVLGAFGDSATVHRIAVAVSQAGGAGVASAQGIAGQLDQLKGVDASYMSWMRGDVKVERAAPGVYLNTLFDNRSHVDTIATYLTGMSDKQFDQLGVYTSTVMQAGGLSSHKQNETLAGAWIGLQGSPAAISQLSEGVSIVGLGFRNIAQSISESVGRLNPGFFSNSQFGKLLKPFLPIAGPSYIVPPGPSAPQIPAKLYHYTNEAGMNGIVDSQSMNPSLKAINPNDVRYGNGQYLSDIEPGTKTPAQLSKAFINNPFQGARYTHYVEIDTKDLNVIIGRPGVYVVPNDNPLNLVNRITGNGRVGK